MINAPYYYYFTSLCPLHNVKVIRYFLREEIMVTNCTLYNFEILTKIFFIVQGTAQVSYYFSKLYIITDKIL